MPKSASVAMKQESTLFRCLQATRANAALGAPPKRHPPINLDDSDDEVLEALANRKHLDPPSKKSQGRDRQGHNSLCHRQPRMAFQQGQTRTHDTDGLPWAVHTQCAWQVWAGQTTNTMANACTQS